MKKNIKNLKSVRFDNLPPVKPAIRFKPVQPAPTEQEIYQRAFNDAMKQFQAKLQTTTTPAPKKEKDFDLKRLVIVFFGYLAVMAFVSVICGGCDTVSDIAKASAIIAQANAARAAHEAREWLNAGFFVMCFMGGVIVAVPVILWSLAAYLDRRQGRQMNRELRQYELKRFLRRQSGEQILLSEYGQDYSIIRK
jgi:hypothetical protein